MGKLKYSFPVLFAFFGVIASALLMENVGFLTNNPTGELSNSYFILIFAIAILCYTAAYFFEHRMNKTRIDFVLFGFLLVFFICGLIPLWTFKDMSIVNGEYSTVLSLTWIDKTRFSMTFGLFILTLYSLFFLFSKSIVTPRRLIIVYVVVIIVCYVCFIYSLIAEIDSYEELFNEGRPTLEIKSLFWNPNMYAGTMLMGISSCMILNSYKKNIFSYISIFVCYFFLICSLSVISIFMGTVALLIYFLYDSISMFKKGKMAPGYICIIIYILTVTALVCVIAMAFDGERLGNFSKIVQSIYKEFSRVNYGTFSNRTQIWEFAISSLKSNNLNLAFGYGFGLSKVVIQTWNGLVGGTVTSTHNGPIQVFFNYGIVGVVVYGSFLLMTFYALIRLLKKHTRFAITYFIVEMIFLGYSMAESVIFFNSNVQGILVGLVFYLPVLIKYKSVKHNEIYTNSYQPTLSIGTLDDSLLVKAVSGVLISLVVSIIPLLFFDGVKNNNLVYQLLVLLLICLSISVLFFPYLVYLWHKDTSLLSFRIRMILNTAFMLVLFAGSAGIYYLFRPLLHGSYLYYFPIVMVLVYLIEIIYYSIVKRPSFKAFLFSFVAIFKTFVIAIISSLVCILLIIFVVRERFGFDGGYLKYIIIFTLNFLMFYVFSILFMFRDTKAIIDYFETRNKNSVCLSLLKDKVSRKK